MDNCCEYTNYGKCYLGADTDMTCDGHKYECKNHSSKDKKIIKNENGALRQTREEKGYFRLIPYSLLNHMSQFYKQSSKKYPENNWRKGMDIKDCYDSAFRHMAKAIEMLNTGEKVGNEDEDLIHHLRATIWNITCILDDFDKKETKNV